MSGNIFLSSTEVSVAETAGYAVVPISRTGDLSLPVTLTIGLTADTATAGADYTGGFSTLTMAAGAGSAVVQVPIINDNLAEATEVFTLSIVNINGGTLLAPRTTRVSILDDENPAPQIAEPPLVSNYLVTEQAVFTGLKQPIRMAFSPIAPNLAYVAEKNGVLKVVDVTTGAQLSTFLDINGKVNQFGDRGMLDVAFHPDFKSNHFVYVVYTVDPPGVENFAAGANASYDGSGNRYSYVSRFTADAATNYTTAVAGSEVILLGGAGKTLASISGGGQLNYNDPVHVNLTASERLVAPGDLVIGGFRQDYLKVDSTTHVGGGLAFGPDGMLYVSTGDGTSFDITDPRTFDIQDVNSLSGKILRVDPLTGDGLVDNPFVAPGMNLDTNAAKVWALGLRNPYSLTFDPAGRTITSETGWFSWEEINAGGRGTNYGWPYYEGGDAGVRLPTPGYRDDPRSIAFYASGTVNQPALHAFSHATADPGFQVQAIVGSDVVYSGNRYPGLFTNDYFFTDFPQGEVYTMDVNDPRQVTYLYTTPTGFGPTGMVQNANGYVYFVDVIRGEIGRLLIADKTASPYVLGGDATWDAATATYTLTTDNSGQQGSLFSGTRIDVRYDFTLDFDLFLGTRDAGADGIAFVLQNDPAGTAAKGWGGGGFGMGGVKNALAIEFDTWDNTLGEGLGFGDIATDHTNIYRPDGGLLTTATSLGNIEDGTWHGVQVTWNAATRSLAYSVDGKAMAGLAGLDLVGDILGGSNFGYFGFSASTGGASNLQQVRLGGVNATMEGAKPFYTGFTTAGDATLDAASATYTLTAEQILQSGAISSSTRIDVRQDFTLDFDLFLGRNDAGADGIAFVLQNDPAGAAAKGWGGGGFGIGGMKNALAIEFDTWDNAAGAGAALGELATDHTAIYRPDGGLLTTATSLGNIEDGAWHSVHLTWNAATQSLAYSVAGKAMPGLAGINLAADVLGGSNYGYFGFSAGTGGAFNLQQVRVTGVAATMEAAAPAAVPGFTPDGDATLDATGTIYTLTAAVPVQLGTVVSNARLDVRQDMVLSFDLFLGNNDAGADGMAFVLHNDPAGMVAKGWGGGGFGIGGMKNALAIEFDTWDNEAGAGAANGELATDHTSLYRPDGGLLTAATSLGNIEDGAWHAVRVTWSAASQSLAYTFDGKAMPGLAGINLAADVLGGSNFAYAGVSAATGGAVNLQQLRITGLEMALEAGSSFAGSAGADRLVAVAGANTLNGGAGDDILVSGSGNDRLTGGLGSDRFVIGPGAGADVIADFAASGTGQDLLDLTALGLGDFAALSARMVQNGADLVITLPGEASLTLLGVAKATMDATDVLL